MDHLQSSSPIGSPAEVGMGGPSASVGDADNTTPKVGGGPNQLLQHDSSQVIHTTANPNRLKIEVMTPNLGENVVINVDVPDGKLESNSPAPFPLDNRNDNLQATPREQSPRGENTSLRIQRHPKHSITLQRQTKMGCLHVLVDPPMIRPSNYPTSTISSTRQT